MLYTRFVIAIALARQLLGHSRIVHICGRCLVSTYQFGISTDNHMVFVSEECLIALLCPTCVNVFVALLMGMVTPWFPTLSLFDLLVLFSGVSLSWSNNEAGIYTLSLDDNKAERI